ncbi:MAG: bifunctional molybdenum cofactor biosynthesis protein MoaC/MoaB, partial [Leptospiraceae bacterium]|nr:bifunctional molybdenum cofactor biosynthesis protein MoaC/MoaB [Leptospiraceae bacterium]
MKDITSKKTSLREATASGLVIFSKETLQLIKEDKLPKGDLLNIARASGFLAAKQTPNLIPHCHPISIDSLKIDYEFI